MMKSTLLFVTLPMIFASPSALAKSEIETLRSRCSEQERQIRHLENENAQLRADPHEPHTPTTKPEAAATTDGQLEADTSSDTTPEKSTIYSAKAGDSLEKIARKTNSSSQQLANINGLKINATLHPGQKLKIPATAPAAVVTPSAKSGQNTYTIQQGDTFSSIARKTRTSTEALVTANPKVKPTALRPGQIINLSGSSTTEPSSSPTATPAAKSPATPPATPPKPAPATPKPAPTPALAVAAETKPAPTPTKQSPAGQETPAPASTDKKFRPITIEAEMTYGEFAAKHGTDPERLNALNGLDLSAAAILAKGSELYVPAQP